MRQRSYSNRMPAEFDGHFFNSTNRYRDIVFFVTAQQPPQ